MNSLQRQARFDHFVHEYDAERPHEALGMTTPAEFYAGSARTCQGLPKSDNPLHDRDVLITASGRIWMRRKRIDISTVMAGQMRRLNEVEEGIWVVTITAYDLVYIDLEQKTLQPIADPSGARVLSMARVGFITHVSGLDDGKIGAPGRIRTHDPQIRSLGFCYFLGFLFIPEDAKMLCLRDYLIAGYRSPLLEIPPR